MKDYSFGNYICALRTGLGLSQYQLGNLVGVTDKAVSKWENSEAKPRLSTCYRLASIFGVDIDELLSCKQHIDHFARKDLNKMNQTLWKQAYDRLSIFGKDVPVQCWSRLATEEAALHDSNAIQHFAILGNMEAEARKNNAFLYVSGTITSSFTAWLLGGTKINPLPPHYRCPRCGKTEFSPIVTSGFDLPPKKCFCGMDFLRDGHNIPFEGYRKFTRLHSNTELHLPQAFKPLAIKTFSEFYNGKAEILPVKMINQQESCSFIEHYVALSNKNAKPPISEDGCWHTSPSEFYQWQEDMVSFSFCCSDKLDMIQKI